ncbi:unnamed protein product [Urochloa humidicola]
MASGKGCLVLVLAMVAALASALLYRAPFSKNLQSLGGQGCILFPRDVDVVIMPNLIDLHGHLDEPGHAKWESFSTGTRAAAAGQERSG